MHVVVFHLSASEDRHGGEGESGKK
jgi:hypothetical protein